MRKIGAAIWIVISIQNFPGLAKQKVKLSLCIISSKISTTTRKHMGEWGYSSTILDLGIR
jgi:hypothetical protein